MGRTFPFAVALALVLLGCRGPQVRKEVRIPEVPQPPPQTVPSPPPDFRVVEEDVSPLTTHRVSLNMRAAPLRDVLFVIARDSGLNLIMEKGVDPDVQITVVLERVTLKEALEAIFSNLDYYYEIRGNLLVVRATDTRVFRIRTMPTHQDYSVDVGGDILGGVMAEGQGQLKGSVSRSEKADPEAYKFWEGLEKALGSILTHPLEGFFVNRMTGTVMVTATRPHMEKVERLIEEVNRALSRQVLIEAKVVEVNLSEAFRYGINWDLLREGDRASWSWELGASTTGFTDVIPATSPFSEISLRFFKTGRNIQAVLQALSEFGDIRTLSNPRVLITNGQTALLTVGRSIAFISEVETTTETETGTISYTVETSSLLSGIMIGIVPHIGDEGEVSLTITPIVSNLVDLKEVSFGDQYMVQLPTMDLRELSTTVTVRDGEVLVIGGLMKKEEREQKYGVPFLQDIPLLGEAFKGRSVQESTTELVIILRPRVMVP